MLQVVSHRHKDPILAAAYDCVIDVGLRRTTVADVARRAGISRMTFYRQYGDLDDAFGSLLTAEQLALIEQVRAATAGLATARERVVEMVALGGRALAEHPLLRRVLDLDPEALLPYFMQRLGSGQRAIVGVLRKEVADGLADGSIRPLDPETAADLILLTSQSIIFSGRLIGAEGRWDVVLGELRQLIDRYLAP